MLLYDNHGRSINYLRLAVTDRCNLRCFYCMPAEGVTYAPKQELLSYAEMERLLRLLAKLGITKVRITGGEPFVRRGLLPFLRRVKAIPGIHELHLTTNGVLTAPHVAELKALGIASVNLSLDALSRERFLKITRRDDYARVMHCFYRLLEAEVPTKINTVVMKGQNTEDIIPLAELTRTYPVSVRFIEEMPFNGTERGAPLLWTHHKINETLRMHYPGLERVPDVPHSTAYHFRLPGGRGTVGVIAAYSRTFCGTCNRIRLTATGALKTCLYDQGVLNVKQLLRDGASDEQLAQAFVRAFAQRAKDGRAAERQRDPAVSVTESMSTIGG
jgi:cyclic pyranopterin phosphate synthase